MNLFRNKNAAAAPSGKGAAVPNHDQEIAKSAMTSILGSITAEDDRVDGPELDAAIRMTQRASQRTDPERVILPGFNLVNLDDESDGQENPNRQASASMPYVKGPHGEPLALDDEDALAMKTEPETEDMDMVTNNMAVLSQSTEIKGDVSVKGDMRICGVVHGNVFSDGSIIIGGGRVDGDVKAKSIRLDPGSEVNGNLTSEGDAILSGSVTGNVTAHDLKLCKGSILKGSTITAQLFSVEGGAIIDSALHIGLVKPEEPAKPKNIQVEHARPAAPAQHTVKQPATSPNGTMPTAAAAN